jgi:nucleoside-diphosphate-sugar epimerase
VSGNFLVTGCAGMIGARLVEHLVGRGNLVVGVDNARSRKLDPVQEWRLSRLLDLPGFQFHDADIRDRAALRRAFAGTALDGVFHLAARTGVRESAVDPEAYVATNVRGTHNVLEECRRHGVRKFILASSSSVYGNIERPFSEDADLGRPLSVYAATKRAAEALTRRHHERYALDATVLRYFTVYGVAGRPDMAVFRFVHRIVEGIPLTVYGDGSQRRDFTYVDDIVRGTEAGLRPLGFEVINLGSDQPVSVLDVLREIEHLVGREARIEFAAPDSADAPETWAKIARARAVLGWSPEVTLACGLQRCIAWYLEHRGCRLSQYGRRASTPGIQSSGAPGAQCSHPVRGSAPARNGCLIGSAARRLDV